jgi:hypothetical protein
MVTRMPDTGIRLNNGSRTDAAVILRQVKKVQSRVGSSGHSKTRRGFAGAAKITLTELDAANEHAEYHFSLISFLL